MTDEQCKKICNCITGLTFVVAIATGFAALSVSLAIYKAADKIECRR